MNNTFHFQLEAAIVAWRNSLSHERTIQAEDLEELEQHIRDQVSHLVQQGYTEKAAFEEAMRAFGSRTETQSAFRNVYWGKIRRERKLKDEFVLRVSIFTNYAKVALRNLFKQKGYAFINILGLAIGLTCFILIALFVQYEFSFDKFHNKPGEVFRIAKENQNPNQLGPKRSTPTPAPLVHALVQEFPEVESATQFAKANSLISIGNKKHFEAGIFATVGFFDVFDFPLLKGSTDPALNAPNAILLTESLARKYFRDEDAIGQTLTVSHSGEHFDGKLDMLVTGIVADVPANSHFTFDFIVSVLSSPELENYLESWSSNSYFTYARLRPDHSLPAFATKLAALAPKHLSDNEHFRDRPEEIGAYVPQALTDIHLKSNIIYEFGGNGNIGYIYLFSAIALLILLIACINYINLATARSAKRAVEVGVRKAMGAYRSQLVGQFLSEAIIPAIVALMIAAALVLLLLPTFNALTAREIAFNIPDNGRFLLVLLGIGLGVGILAGGYPAVVMSSFHPVSMMKGLVNQRAGKPALRNTLVVVQFSITIALIIGTIVIQRQLHYFQTANTGITRDQVISIQIDDKTLFERYVAVKQTLQEHPNVLAVTAAQSNPMRFDSATPAREWEGVKEGQSVQVYRSAIQYDFIDVFDLNLVEGRNFSPDMATDESNGLIINETLMRQLGWNSAIGKRLNFWNRDRVIGVVKDFNFRSLHEEIPPLAMYLDTQSWFPYQHVFVKVGPGNMQETIGHLNKTMMAFSPDHPFEYYFLDDDYNNMYQTEARLGNLLSYFTFLALFIACMGLLGLAAFLAQQRTKEIGVRKVLGATQSDILFLLSKDFTRLVLVAFILGAPIGYFALNRWLQEFAYRVTLGPGTILLAGGIVLLIAWLTVSYQSIRAAYTNPVHSLRQK